MSDGLLSTPLDASLNSFMPLPNPRISYGIFFPPNINKIIITITVNSVPPIPKIPNKMEFMIIDFKPQR